MIKGECYKTVTSMQFNENGERKTCTHHPLLLASFFPPALLHPLRQVTH